MPALDHLRCTLLPGTFSTAEQVPALYNHLYRIWKRTWGEVLTQIGHPEALDANNFLRQNIILVLHAGDEVAAASAMTFFNLSAEAARDHPYLKPFASELPRGSLAQAGLVTSSEYLAVEPEYRKSKTGISLSEVLVGLMVKVSLELRCQLLLGTAIRSARVDETCKKFGYREVGTFEKYGLDCVLLSGRDRDLHPHPEPATASLIDSFWSTKRNLTSFDFENANVLPLRRAA